MNNANLSRTNYSDCSSVDSKEGRPFPGDDITIEYQVISDDMPELETGSDAPADDGGMPYNELLDFLLEAGSSGKPEEEMKQSLNGFNDSNPQPINGSSCYNAIKGLAGQDIFTALAGISNVGMILDQGSHNLSMSGLAVVTLLRFINDIMDTNVARIFIAVIYCLSAKDNKSLVEFTRAAGIGKDRLYRALDELRTNGLVPARDHPNAEGAGKDTNENVFRQLMEPLCAALNISEEELTARQLEQAIAKLTKQSNEEDRSERSVNSNEANQEIEQNDSDGDGQQEDSNGVGQQESSDDVGQAQEDSDNAGQQEDSDDVGQAQEDSDNAGQQEDSGKEGLQKEAISEVEQALNDGENEEASAKKGPTMEDVVTKYHEAEERSARLDEGLNIINNSDGRLADRGYNKEISETISNALHRIGKAMNDVKAAVDSFNASSSDTAFNLLDNTLIESFLFVLLLAINLIIKTCDKLLDILQTEPLESCDNWYIITRSMKRAVRSNTIRNDINGYIYICNSILKLCDSGASGKEKSPNWEDYPLVERANEAIENLLALLRVIGKPGDNIMNHTAAAEAYDFLQQVKKGLETVLQAVIPEDNKGASEALNAYVETVYSFTAQWLNRMKSRRKIRDILDVCRTIVTHQNRDRVGNLQKDFEAALSGEEKSSSEEPKSSEASENVHSELASEEYRQRIKDELNKLINNISIINKNLQSEANLKDIIQGKNTELEADKKIEALSILVNNIINPLHDIFASNSNREEAWFWTAVETVVENLKDNINKWLSKWKKNEDGSYYASKGTINGIVNSMTSKSTKNKIRKTFELFRHKLACHGENIPDSLIQVNLENKLDPWNNKKSLSADERNELIRKFWNEGKDPTDIEVWLDYIVTKDCEKNYGGPTGGANYCNITKRDLERAFFYYTGISFSSTMLSAVLKNKMGYSGRQCAKLYQVGTPHPLKGKQYDIISDCKQNYDKNTTLVLSIDTKAFVVLGRFQHDHGVLVYSQDNGVFKVYDHDFPLFLRDIYKNGSKLFDSGRLDERAVLRPVGALCLNDNSGYVSLVIGKDTAESMNTLLHKVIDIKRKEMPQLEKVVILADGGGANIANGIAWTEELLKLTDDVQLPVEMHHFAPGCSRHNPVERGLWGAISNHWKNKIFWDIEHTMAYIQDTKTSSGLNITCWLDKRRYLTNAEKKEAGEVVLTRQQLNMLSEGRVIHQFQESDGDLYKWNYTVFPGTQKGSVSQGPDEGCA